MKIKAIFEVEIALTDENVVPTSDDALSAIIKGFDIPSVVCQPGVDDGWQVWINGVEWSVDDESAQQRAMRLDDICVQLQARLLRGDSDQDLLALLSTVWEGKK